MFEYKPNNFTKKTYEEENGAIMWDFLNRYDNIVRMETATYFGYPAAEALSESLICRFGDDIRKNDDVHQMIGNMIRQIMELYGYRLKSESETIKSGGNIFGTAALYEAKKHNA